MLVLCMNMSPTFVSMANDLCAQTPYGNVNKPLVYLGENPSRHHIA